MGGYSYVQWLCVSRVFCTVKGSKLSWRHGFINKSQKTPKKDIDLARTRKNQWINEV